MLQGNTEGLCLEVDKYQHVNNNQPMNIVAKQKYGAEFRYV